MKLTPLDIHHKEFHHALRGYSEEEVDTFLDEVAEEFERLFKENIDLSEKLEAASAKVRDYQSMEVTLNNTMVSAQRSAEQIVAGANDEASVMLRDAEVKAKEIIHSAMTDKQKAQTDLVRIKQAEEDFRARFGDLLRTYLGGIAAIDLPSDVGEIVDAARADVVAGVPAAADERPALDADVLLDEPAAEPEDIADAMLEEVADVADSSADDASDDDEPGADAKAGPVESMSFGELDGPDLEDDFGEPAEFAMPSLEAFGERDDDLDIEEID